MAAYTITGTAIDIATLTPMFTFPSGTIEVEIDDVSDGFFTSGVSKDVVVAAGEKVEYICSDWDAITGIEIQNDHLNCDVGAWQLPTDLTVLNLGSFQTGYSGDISSWVLPTGLVDFDISYTKMTGTITNWVMPNTLVNFDIGVSDITGVLTDWDLSSCPSLEDFYANASSLLSGNVSGWAFPDTLERLYLHSPSGFTGSIANWDLSATALTYLAIGTSNLSGNISGWTVPTTCTKIWFNGSGIDYDSTGGWLKDITSEAIDITWDNSNLTYTQVDNILADLVTSGVANGELVIDGTNSGPSSAGTTSKGTLETAGWSITINAEVVFPTKASVPGPADDAEDQLLTVDLSWTKDGGDEVYVYLDKKIGEDPPITKVVDNVDTETYDPGELDADTTYVWRVDTTDGSLTTTGDQWEFTTGALPDKATVPSPANSGTNIAISTNLGWTKGASDTVLVYLDKKTENNPPTTKVVDDENANSYDPLSDLTNNTTYVWRVDTKNNIGITTGDQWEFTTVAEGGDSELSFNRSSTRGLGLGMNRGVV